jgi:hypothetical protein
MRSCAATPGERRGGRAAVSGASLRRADVGGSDDTGDPAQPASGALAPASHVRPATEIVERHSERAARAARTRAPSSAPAPPGARARSGPRVAAHPVRPYARALADLVAAMMCPLDPQNTREARQQTRDRRCRAGGPRAGGGAVAGLPGACHACASSVYGRPCAASRDVSRVSPQRSSASSRPRDAGLTCDLRAGE